MESMENKFNDLSPSLNPEQRRNKIQELEESIKKRRAGNELEEKLGGGPKSTSDPVLTSLTAELQGLLDEEKRESKAE